MLEIGRQARPQLYNLLFEKAEPLVPQARRLGLRETAGFRWPRAGGAVRAEIARIAREVVRSGADSVAVCLLFSFVNPAHEKSLAEPWPPRDCTFPSSHKILPEYREFERTSTTVVNAYLVPVMSGYLSEIESTAKAHERGARRPAPQRAKSVTENSGSESASCNRTAAFCRPGRGARACSNDSVRTRRRCSRRAICRRSRGLRTHHHV